MGYSIAWYAVREEKAEQFLQRVGLAPTGEAEEVPESLIAMASLDTGWRVIWYNKYSCPFLQPRHLKTLSLELDIMHCLVEEHVMASSAELWSRGKRQWWLSHESEQDSCGLDVDGELPDSFPAIRQQLEALQVAEGGADADVDYIFDIPLKVAQSIVGFKHDEECKHIIDERFMVLHKSEVKLLAIGGRFRS